MTPEEAYNKCEKENRRIPELQEIISTDPKWSFYYARYIIGGAWELGEEVISKNPNWSFSYARYIIDGAWELGEEVISKNPNWSFSYAYEVIKGPFEKCHSVIFNSSWKNDYIKFLKSINYDVGKISEWML